MNSLSPELWHIVASYLSVQDATQLRLVSRFFADIAGAYILPDVSLYMHQDDFERLRGISSTGVLAPNVRSLTYLTTGYTSPVVTFKEFKEHHKQALWAQKLSRLPGCAHDVEPADDPTLLSEYEKYEQMVAVQDQIGVDMADLACLKDAVAQFTALRHVTMSSGNLFLGRSIRGKASPFKTSAPTEWPRPEGVRHLEVLLKALAHNKLKVESLRAGELEWVFFDKTATELERLFEPIFDAVHVELEIALDLDENLNDLDGNTEKCRQFMKRGMLRDVLARMTRLQWLRVGFLCDLNVPGKKPAMMKDIMSFSHHWPCLQRLELSSIEADRHTLMQFLSLHKDTLRFLCLQDVDLGETSWEKLLPEIRNNLCLEDACVCGTLVGQVEDMTDKGLPETWDLDVPEIWENDMRASINCYCQKGGENYPNELPLTDQVVQKNFDQYVRCHVRKTQAEEREERRQADTARRREWLEAGLIPRSDSEDSESSHDGYDSGDPDGLYDGLDEMVGVNDDLDVNDMNDLDDLVDLVDPYDGEDVEDAYNEMRLQGFYWGSDGSDGGVD